MARTPSHLLAFGNEEQAQRLQGAEALEDWTQFVEFGQAYAPLVFRYFWFHALHQDAAEELATRTFLRALRAVRNYRVEYTPFNIWLFGIARRVLAQHCPSGAKGAAGAEGAPLRLVDGQLDLQQALSELTPSERDLIALKFGGGLTHGEIAEITGLYREHVILVLTRTLRKLRTRLIGVGGADAQ